MHADAWLDAPRHGATASRASGSLAALDDARRRRRRPCSRRSPTSRPCSRPASSPRRWPSSRPLACRRSPPIFGRLGLPMPPPTRDPARGRLDHGEAFRWLWGEFTLGPPRRTRERPGERGRDPDRHRAARAACRRAADALPPPASTSRPSARRSPRSPTRSSRCCLDRRPRDRPSASRSTPGRRDPRRDPADVRRLPRARAHQGVDRRPARGFGRPVEVVATFEVPWTSRSDHAGGPRRAAGGRHRAAGRASRRRGRRSSTSRRACRARTAARAGHASRTSSARPSAGRSATARDCRQPFEAIKPV